MGVGGQGATSDDHTLRAHSDRLPQPQWFGRDWSGNRINAVSLAHSLGLFDGPVKADTERQRHGRQFTAWSLYCWEA